MCKQVQQQHVNCTAPLQRLLTCTALRRLPTSARTHTCMEVWRLPAGTLRFKTGRYIQVEVQPGLSTLSKRFSLFQGGSRRKSTHTMRSSSMCNNCTLRLQRNSSGTNSMRSASTHITRSNTFTHMCSARTHTTRCSTLTHSKILRQSAGRIQRHIQRRMPCRMECPRLKPTPTLRTACPSTSGKALLQED